MSTTSTGWPTRGRIFSAYAIGSAREGVAKLVFVEKILAADELLDPRWPVAGTTGYEFGDRVLGLFLDPEGCAGLLEFGAQFARVADSSFAALSVQRQARGLRSVVFGRPRPAHPVDAAPRSISRRPATTSRCGTCGWRGVALTIHLAVYRTYLEVGVPSAPDRSRVVAACTAATACGTLESEVRRALERITAALLGAMPPGSPWLEVARRWQQLSGAVMAKGSEDTATYRWVGVPVLADVAGDPDRTDDALGAFHRLASSRMGSLNTTSTHDSKRNEDARCRVAVLSEAADEWATLVATWHELGVADDAVGLPQPLEELSIYESLFALWPTAAHRREADMVERVKGYVVKAAREAKEHTSWTDPHVDYEDMVTSFVDVLLERIRSSASP